MGTLHNVWGLVSHAVEEKLKVSLAAPSAPQPRVLVRNPSDMAVLLPDEQTNYQPANPARTKYELWRYLHETIDEMSDLRTITLAGPDETKIGQAFPVEACANGNPKTEICAVAPPQV